MRFYLKPRGTITLNEAVPVMNGSPRVSVILPSYNSSRYIREAIESVFAQNYNNIEVIVVNDGSPDTLELERVLESFIGRISYIKQDNEGPSSARNVAIRSSTGDLIALLDSDDVWEPNCLKVQVQFLLEHPDVDLVYGNGIIFDESGRKKTLTDSSPSDGEVTFEALVKERCCVPTSGVMVRREAIFGAGLFDESLRWSEDFDLWLRIIKSGHKIAYHREEIFRYRRHAGGVSMQPAALLRHSSRVLEKMLRDFELTPSERQVAQEKKAIFDALILVTEGKLAFQNRDFKSAADKLSEANATFRQPKLAVTAALLRVCPQLLWHARKLLSRS